MDEKEIFEKFKSILTDKFGKEEDKIAIESDLVNDLGIDSFGAIELKFELENKFKIMIDNREFASVKTVKDVVKRIYKSISK